MTGTGVTPRSPREWLGDEPYPWPALDEVAEGARLVACYCVASKQIALTKNDRPYLRLQLTDRSGEIEGRVWDDAERVDGFVAAGGFVGVRGRIESYRGQRQLKVEEIAPLAVGPEDLDLFLPRTPRDLDDLEAQLDALIASVEDAPLRTLLTRLLGRASETGRAFRRAPAAKRNHHAYVGGLLEHTVSVAWVCSALAQHYGDALDRDLLVAGALLHDIGKTREIGIGGGFPYTDEGHLLGHIVLGIQMVRDAAREVPELAERRALLLQHLVASHQGKYEWQSPKIPMTLEALLLHYVDDLDAKMHQALALVAASEMGWTGYDASFGRSFLRHHGIAEKGPGYAAAAVSAAPANSPPFDENPLPWDEAADMPLVPGSDHAGAVGPAGHPGEEDESPWAGAGGRAAATGAEPDDPDPEIPVQEAEDARPRVPRLGSDTLDLFCD